MLVSTKNKRIMARPHELLLIGPEDLGNLELMCSKGTHPARELKRAEILILGNQCYTVNEIAAAVGRDPNTVRNVRRRYIEEGLESAIKDRPRPGKPQKIFSKEEAMITTIACSEAPSGHSRWTIRMIADKFIQLSEVDHVCPETIRRVLKKANSSRGRKKSGVLAK